MSGMPSVQVNGHLSPLSPTIDHMTAPPTLDQRLRDLARLRRVRDRIDREYAQPLDVEALARGVHMSAGHLSREFKAAYGESPYSYLMTRRIERAMALLRRGDLSVTEVCFAVGLLLAGDVQHPLHRAGRDAAERLPARGAPSRPPGLPSCVAKQVTQTDQESRSTALGRSPSVTGHGPHHSRQLPPARPTRRLAGLLPRRARLRGAQRRRLQRRCAGSPSARPASPAPRSCSTRRRPTPASPTTSGGPSPR